MRTSVRVWHGWLCLSLWLCGSASAVAAEPPPAAESSPASTCPICRHANNQSAPYAEQATANLARGLTNTFFGWTEMLVRPTAEVERHGNLLNGVGQGISHSVSRTAAGIGEALTFWMPKSVGGPLPLTSDCPICMSAKRATSTAAPASSSTPPSRTP